MELPREVQQYIFSFLYDKWRPQWNRVMKELKEIQSQSKIWIISRFMVRDWYLRKPKHYKICLDCGNYYSLPLYGSLAMYCDCP